MSDQKFVLKAYMGLVVAAAALDKTQPELANRLNEIADEAPADVALLGTLCLASAADVLSK